MTDGIALKYNLKKKNQIFTIMKNLQAFMQGGHETVSTHINLKFLAKLTQKHYYFKFNYFLCCFFFFF